MIQPKLVPILLAGLISGVQAAEAPAAPAADSVLINGEIYTPGGWAAAIAIQRGVIVAIGPTAAVERYEGPHTQVIDLHGAAVLPGLHDMHLHPMDAGYYTEFECRFPQGSKPAAIQETLRQCASKRAKGEWIMGGQWDTASFGSTPPNRQLLDRAAPNNPVFLNDISYHSVWVNSEALRLAGITRATPNPPNGFIDRDAKGEPNGVLRETATDLVRQVIPPYTAEQNVRAMKSALNIMLSYGITSFTDADMGDAALKAYATLSDQGQLKQRVKGCLGWHNTVVNKGSAEKAEYIELRSLYARERFSPSCIKIFLDGVPLESRTAAMVEPYLNTQAADPARAKGVLNVPPETLNAALVDFDALGFTVKMHAAGDAAVREGLDAIEAARKANGFSGQLHEVAHNSFVQMDDIRRARALGATFEMSPYIWYPNPIIPDIVKVIGPERMVRWIPIKDAIDAGALVVPGSDWNVVPSVSPWIAIETLVTRQKPGGGGEMLGAVEKITLQQAIDMFTVNSAREMGNRNKVGTLERGMLADLVVLDRNPFKIPVTQVHDTRVTMTMINGEVVYRAAQTP